MCNSAHATSHFHYGRTEIEWTSDRDINKICTNAVFTNIFYVKENFNFVLHRKRRIFNIDECAVWYDGVS